MAQYKVPQDVEAEDKLLGPFTFRQFIYLLIVAGFIALAWALFQVFPLLVIIPIPIILLFGALALPLKKDQPMETYLSAIVSFYLKPRKRFWMPGQPESTILITAPKKVEVSRTKNLSQDEATHRLSFLAEIVDSEGYAIKGAGLSSMKEEVFAEANQAPDMFDSQPSDHIEQVLQNEANLRHTELVNQMRSAIEKAESIHNSTENISIQKFNNEENTQPTQTESSSTHIKNETQPRHTSNQTKTNPSKTTKTKVDANTSTTTTNPAIIDLANDPDLSVETIAKEANRLNAKQEKEVYISLH